LWKEGDIFTLSPPESPENPPDCLERKIILGEEVSVWTPDLSSGLFLLTSLIFKLTPVIFPGFSFALSLYPSRTGISAGPGESDPDFTLEGGELQASAVHNKKANLGVEETTSRVQKEGLKEYKNVFNLDDASGSDFPKTPEEPSKKNKTWKKKKIAGYSCCFFLFLIAGLLIFSKAGLEPTFPSFNISKNNDTDFPLLRVQLESRGEKIYPMQDLREENPSKTQLPISSSHDGSSSNLSSVNLDDRAENVSPELQGLIKETNNSSEVGNAGAGNGTEGNESIGNGIMENKSVENGIAENESTVNGTLENKNIENEVIEYENIGKRVLENESACNEALKLEF
jgi:hypothetical protein